MLALVLLVVAWAACLIAHQNARFDIRECRHLYLDIGSNIGVQVRKLFQPTLYRNAPVLKLFDNYFGPAAQRRQEVCAIGVEGNPHRTANLTRLQDCYNRLGWRTMFLTETLFGTENGTRAFYSDLDNAHVEWGSSIFDHRKTGKPFAVKEIDANAFLNDYAKPVSARAGVVLAKMDIEGSEFSVLPHLLKHAALCQSVVRAMFIEWHVRYVPPSMRQLSADFQKAFSTQLRAQHCNATNVIYFDDETFLFDPNPLPDVCV